jgi:hypothetical protein
MRRSMATRSALNASGVEGRWGRLAAERWNSPEPLGKIGVCMDVTRWTDAMARFQHVMHDLEM